MHADEIFCKARKKSVENSADIMQKRTFGRFCSAFYLDNVRKTEIFLLYLFAS